MIYKIGKHSVRHGNIMDQLDSLVGNNKVDFVYSDPPWGSGNIKYWQTMNMKMNNVSNRCDTPLEKFLSRFFDVITTYSTDDMVAVVEYGQRWRGLLRRLAANYGIISVAILESLYGTGKKLPLDIHYFVKRKQGIDYRMLASRLATSYGYDTVKIATSLFKLEGKSILDPCCGLGYTAQLAVDNNMTFYGNELNLQRLQSTIKRLQRGKDK